MGRRERDISLSRFICFRYPCRMFMFRIEISINSRVSSLYGFERGEKCGLQPIPVGFDLIKQLYNTYSPPPKDNVQDS